MSYTNINSHKVTYTINNGLAIYSVGEGKTVLLMPYPHGFSVLPAAEGLLAQILVHAGFRVITFDPPGAFRSTRLAQVTMSEMLNCTEETIHSLNIQNSFSIIGHSLGGLCAIAYTLSNPHNVQKLVLIDTVSGGPAIARYKGMPWGMKRTDPDFWRFIFWGGLLASNLGNLAVHKKMIHLIWKHSYFNQAVMPELNITLEDKRFPVPVRDKWPMVVRQLDYSHQIKQIYIPTLVCGGRFDPQAPISCSEELAKNIPESKLIIFEKSGHYPYVEERQQFKEVVSSFLTPLEKHQDDNLGLI